VITLSVDSVGRTVAIVKGGIVNDGNATLSEYGICWDTEPNPCINGTFAISDGEPIGFTVMIDTLKPETIYYARAFASNQMGTAYGNQLTFTTGDMFTLPVVIIDSVSDITRHSATLTGEVSNNGFDEQVERGFCCNTSGDPTFENSNVSELGRGMGTFSLVLENLELNTTYYARAYATNSMGTTYSEVLVFTTRPIVEIETVHIPGGTFIMGSPSSEPNRVAETEFQREIGIVSFKMGKYEITNAQIAEFLNYFGYSIGDLAQLGYSLHSDYWGLHKIKVDLETNEWVVLPGFEDHPVSSVYWFFANHFCERLGGRLPTEEEWEYACRAGTTTPFNTGNCLTNLDANFYWKEPYKDCNNITEEPPVTTMPVGCFLSNAFGLYDMHGNMAEWTSGFYYKDIPSEELPPDWETSSDYRALRGGSFGSGADMCRSASSYVRGNDAFQPIGFRIVFD
jgi:formylglycine-generating enzyme